MLAIKVAGIVLTVLGGLLVLSGARVTLTQYDLSNSHDVSKALGGFGLALFMLATGIVMLVKSRGK